MFRVRANLAIWQYAVLDGIAWVGLNCFSSYLEPLAALHSLSIYSLHLVLWHDSAADHHVTTRELITLQDPLEDNIYFGSQFGLDGMSLYACYPL